jgi:hypothetical protein
MLKVGMDNDLNHVINQYIFNDFIDPDNSRFDAY